MRAKICSGGVAALAFGSLVGTIALPRGILIGTFQYSAPQQLLIASIRYIPFLLNRPELPGPLAARLLATVNVVHERRDVAPLKSLAQHVRARADLQRIQALDNAVALAPQELRRATQAQALKATAPNWQGLSKSYFDNMGEKTLPRAARARFHGPPSWLEPSPQPVEAAVQLPSARCRDGSTAD